MKSRLTPVDRVAVDWTEKALDSLAVDAVRFRALFHMAVQEGRKRVEEGIASGGLETSWANFVMPFFLVEQADAFLAFLDNVQAVAVQGSDYLFEIENEQPEGMSS